MTAIIFVLLLSISTFAQKAEYTVGANITVREFSKPNDFLSVVTHLPLDAVIEFDIKDNVGPQRYKNGKGKVAMSRGDWIGSVKLISLPSGPVPPKWAGKKLYFSSYHLVDLRKVGAPDPGFGNSAAAKVCEKISKSKALTKSTIGVNSKHGITRYFTPLFPNLTDIHEGKPYRYWCLKFEGSCVVGKTLWNYPNRSYDRSKITCKYGFGNRSNKFNRTNCLNPCTTIAADQKKNKLGSVVYIPGMRGKICPHTGKPIHGCFIVGDVGSAIKGSGRFDLFTGLCNSYDSGRCLDKFQYEFRVSKGARFSKLDRNHSLARELRKLSDQEIKSVDF